MLVLKCVLGSKENNSIGAVMSGRNLPREVFNTVLSKRRVFGVPSVTERCALPADF